MIGQSVWYNNSLVKWDSSPSQIERTLNLYIVPGRRLETSIPSVSVENTDCHAVSEYSWYWISQVSPERVSTSKVRDVNCLPSSANENPSGAIQLIGSTDILSTVTAEATPPLPSFLQAKTNCCNELLTTAPSTIILPLAPVVSRLNLATPPTYSNPSWTAPATAQVGAAVIPT